MPCDAYDEPADRGAGFDSSLPVSCARDAAGGRISAEGDERIGDRERRSVNGCTSTRGPAVGDRQTTHRRRWAMR
jgi:hypothetical protein